jgi:membrane protein involved in colicin uptake
MLFAGGIIAYLLFGLLLWWVLDRYIDPQDSGEKKDLVQALSLIMAGVAGAIGIYYTWRSQRITQRAQAENQKATQKQLTNAQQQLQLSRQSQEENQRTTQVQLENAQEELRLTRQGQLTELFTRAIDQLGNEVTGSSKRPSTVSPWL